ncbi:uncharacterized protein TrAFT101_000878 [Trichoderma asperellum]|uniref:uncharacterized protein n=1 Tax=Trichoderma asperellum TaxID=101201 RepID=UPI0033296E5E|nr:hypothetical protein TrAFT101_000878 [Trichoderma asperellum]
MRHLLEAHAKLMLLSHSRSPASTKRCVTAGTNTGVISGKLPLSLASSRFSLPSSACCELPIKDWLFSFCLFCTTPVGFIAGFSTHRHTQRESLLPDAAALVKINISAKAISIEGRHHGTALR